jgi:hypothetical protein
MKTTGVKVVLGRSRRRLSVVGPSITGIITSSRIKSGGQSSLATRAAAADREIRIEGERHFDDLADIGLVVNVKDAE